MAEPGPETGPPSPRAKLADLCAESREELRAMLDGKTRAPEWGTFSSWAGFPFIQRLKALADLALEAGAPAHYERVRKLAEAPYSRRERRWLLVEMIAAVADCALWCRRGEEPPAAPAPKGPDALSACQPGRRLRGGREIMEAIEGAYSEARWRAFKREALKFNAPIEWPKGKGHPKAFELPLRAWLAERVAAASAAAENRAGRRAVKADADGRPQAYTGGDDQPLNVSKRPKGRNPPGQ